MLQTFELLYFYVQEDRMFFLVLEFNIDGVLDKFVPIFLRPGSYTLAPTTYCKDNHGRHACMILCAGTLLGLHDHELYKKLLTFVTSSKKRDTLHKHNVFLKIFPRAGPNIYIHRTASSVTKEKWRTGNTYFLSSHMNSHISLHRTILKSHTHGNRISHDQRNVVLLIFHFRSSHAVSWVTLWRKTSHISASTSFLLYVPSSKRHMQQRPATVPIPIVSQNDPTELYVHGYDITFLNMKRTGYNFPSIGLHLQSEVLHFHR